MEKFKEKENEFIDFILEEIVYRNVGSFSQLAKKAGVNQSVISRMLKKEVSPNLDTVFKVCEALNLNVFVRER